MSTQQAFGFATSWDTFGHTNTAWVPLSEEHKRSKREQADREEREKRARDDERREKARKDRQERERSRKARSGSSAWHFNPYAVLGLASIANAKEIRAAWVKLVKQHHPDCGGDAARFMDVQKAYEMLKGRR